VKNKLPAVREKSAIAPAGMGLAQAAKRLSLKAPMRVKDLGRILLRPIRPEDEPLMKVFHAALSEETVYTRYFAHLSLESRVRHERLTRICANDDDSFALVAVSSGPAARPAAIYAVGRLSRTEDPAAVDFALLVSDKTQGRGLGSGLMKRLITLARSCGFQRLTGEVLVANHEMLYVCRQFGFSLHTVTGEGLVSVSREL
jgi:acetyltransferase